MVQGCPEAEASMKIFLVFQWEPYEGDWLLHAASTEELAEAWMINHRTEMADILPGHSPKLKIVEAVLDHAFKG